MTRKWLRRLNNNLNIVPDELKERIRKMPGGAGKDINVESKLDMQERLKARKLAEEKYEKDLYD